MGVTIIAFPNHAGESMSIQLSISNAKSTSVMHDSGTPAEGKPVLRFFCFLLVNVQWCNQGNVSLCVIQEKGFIRFSG